MEGNGLFDASVPKGKYLYDIFKEQEIEIITSGNHELYKQNSSNNEFYYTVPNFKDGYLASNLDIYNPETGDLEPLARRFKKFTTKNQGIRILAFGFIFNFHDNNVGNTLAYIADPCFNNALLAGSGSGRKLLIFDVLESHCYHDCGGHHKERLVPRSNSG